MANVDKPRVDPEQGLISAAMKRMTLSYDKKCETPSVTFPSEQFSQSLRAAQNPRPTPGSVFKPHLGA